MNPTAPPMPQGVEELVQMGFQREEAERALVQAGFDVTAAVQGLMGGGMGGDEALLRARAENDILMSMLDDALTDHATKNGELKLTEDGAKNCGLPTKIQFDTMNYHGMDTTDERLQELYAERRGHRATHRFAMTDIVDTFGEKLTDAIHSNFITNKIESKVKVSGYKLMGSLGGKLDKAANKVMKATGMESQQSAPCQQTERKYATIELPEVKLDWVGEYAQVPFGVQCRGRHFRHVSQGYLDGAGCGVTPTAVKAARSEWDRVNQVDPVLWRFKTLMIRLRQAEQGLAETLGVDPNDLKLTLNADYGLSAVIKSLPWSPGDTVIYLENLSYAGKEALKWLRRTHGVELRGIPVPIPFSMDVLKNEVKHVISKSENVKLAVFAEVGYQDGVKLSVRKLASTFHKKQVSVLVDGTMAVGQWDITISGKGADWYVASLSNWMYTEDGCGVIISHPLKQPVTQTLTVSYFDRGNACKEGFNKSFEKEFSYQGLQDFANWCAIHQSLKFVAVSCGGWERIRAYTCNLAKQVVAEVCRLWGTRPIQPDGEHAAMPVIPLPNGAGYNLATAAGLTSYLAQAPIPGHPGDPPQPPAIVRIVTVNIGGETHLCARFTCQIYNDLSEYATAARFISSLQPYRPNVTQQDVDMYTTLN